MMTLSLIVTALCWLTFFFMCNHLVQHSNVKTPCLSSADLMITCRHMELVWCWSAGIFLTAEYGLDTALFYIPNSSSPAETSWMEES